METIKESKMGRPPKYETAEALQEKISEYLELTKAEGLTARPTITGLVLHCGFCDRRSFYDLEKKPDFSYTIKRARSYIAECYERNLYGNACTGSIFALKNLGWTDKQEIQHSSSGATRIIIENTDTEQNGSESKTSRLPKQISI